MLILLMAMLSCKNKDVTVEVPKNLIDKNKFVEVLVDVNLLEGHLTNLNVNMPEIKNNSLGKYKSIFERHGIDNTTYQSSYDYYVQQDVYKEMVDSALAKLTILENKLLKVPDVKQMSLPQFRQLIIIDSMVDFLEVDSVHTREFIIDSLLSYYQKHNDKIVSIGLDSLSFHSSMMNMRKNKLLFKSITSKILEEHYND